MARYRVGNRYLSQSEYDREINEASIVIFALIGAALGFFAGLIASYKWGLRRESGFACSGILALGAGFVAIRFRNAIKLVFGLMLVLTIVGSIVGEIWKNTPDFSKKKAVREIHAPARHRLGR